MSLLEQAKREVDRQVQSSSHEVTLRADASGATASVDVALGKGWDLAAWATYYWNQTYAWAVQVTKTWRTP